jgi:hypothetical protein
VDGRLIVNIWIGSAIALMFALRVVGAVKAARRDRVGILGPLLIGYRGIRLLGVPVWVWQAVVTGVWAFVFGPIVTRLAAP